MDVDRHIRDKVVRPPRRGRIAQEEGPNLMRRRLVASSFGDTGSEWRCPDSIFAVPAG